MNKNPLPCPWCGNAAEVRTNDDNGSAPWLAAWVRCTKRPGCEGEGPVSKLAKPQDSRGAAIAAWNRVAGALLRGVRLGIEAAAVRVLNEKTGGSEESAVEWDESMRYLAAEVRAIDAASAAEKGEGV